MRNGDVAALSPGNEHADDAAAAIVPDPSTAEAADDNPPFDGGVDLNPTLAVDAVDEATNAVARPAPKKAREPDLPIVLVAQVKFDEARCRDIGREGCAVTEYEDSNVFRLAIR